MAKKNILGKDKFFEAILSLKTKAECEKFFEDIFTVRELEDASQRIEVAALLNSGKAYSEIVSKVGASSATISRVNRCLEYGSGGYKIVLDRILRGEEK